MYAAQVRSFGSIHIETAFKLGLDVVESAGFVTIGSGFGIAMHRIADPKHARTGGSDGTDQARKLLVDIIGTEPVDQCQSARFIKRIQNLAQTCNFSIADSWRDDPL